MRGPKDGGPKAWQPPIPVRLHVLLLNLTYYQTRNYRKKYMDSEKGSLYYLASPNHELLDRSYSYRIIKCLGNFDRAIITK